MDETTVWDKRSSLKETQQLTRALLIGTYFDPKEQKLAEAHLDELEQLAGSCNIPIVARQAVHLRKMESATFFTKGKLEELVALAQEKQATLILLDQEVSPAQQRNLEESFGRTVFDRTELILQVFEQHAQTKEAKLQIELAEVTYQMPRLKRLWSHLSRQSGSVGGSGAYLKGEGEKQIEIDRRLLQRRKDQLQHQIEQVRGHRMTQRSARKKAALPVFAIVGYTNGGKSTLLNALTDADVLVEDKLFATLDTTTRHYTLGNNQEILLIDTVGFIRKLPHLLVAAFKSTLEEALYADVLLHLVDASHPLAEEQAKTTLEVLKELGAGDKPIITLLNKVDRAEGEQRARYMRLQHPKSLLISAKEQTGFIALRQLIEQELQALRETLHLRIPQSDYQVVSQILRQGKVLEQAYVEEAIELKAQVPKSLSGLLRRYAIEEQEEQND